MRWQKKLKHRRVGKKMNFFSGWVCKLFVKALVVALPCAALAMCLQNALALHKVNAVNVLI